MDINLARKHYIYMYIYGVLQILFIYLEISINGAAVTPTSDMPYDDTYIRIILFNQANLTWYKVFFKDHDISLLVAWSLSGIKYALSMPSNTPIVFTGECSISLVM